MAKIKNVSPLGTLVIPSLGITVNAGATFDVDDATAKALLEQADNFAPGDKAAAAAVAPTTTDDQSA